MVPPNRAPVVKVLVLAYLISGVPSSMHLLVTIFAAVKNSVAFD